MVDLRAQQACQWVASQLHDECRVETLAGDASFRRYFRVVHGAETFVLMDAPPEKESVDTFLAVRSWLERADVRVPRLIAEARSEGFLLLEDFGDMTWAVCLSSSSSKSMVDMLFEDALAQLRTLQASTAPITLPRFDIERMQQECSLYLDWYLPYVAGYSPSTTERESFHDALLPILNELFSLPMVPVHLDYHSRNLMLPAEGLPLGVIDFQDAVSGPVTYDLASLLYDCYQNYPEKQRVLWSRRYFDALEPAIGEQFADFEAWHHALRLTATQRHIKAIGIFARLAFRDGKRQFLDEIPLTRLHLHDEMQALGLNHPALQLLQIEPKVSCQA